MLHEGDYKTNTFTPVVLAMDLCAHVYHVTDNKNKFPEYTEQKIQDPDKTCSKILIARDDSLINKVREQAFQIYMCAFSANEINLNKHPEQKDRRLALQARAIELCNWHLATIQLLKKPFHLRKGKLKYWGKLTLKVRTALVKWNDGDRDRYKNI